MKRILFGRYYQFLDCVPILLQFENDETLCRNLYCEHSVLQFCIFELSRSNHIGINEVVVVVSFL